MTQPEDIDLIAASLRADSTDLDTYSRVLTSSLADALPAEMVEIVRDQSLRDRLAGRPGVVAAIRLKLGDTTLELARGSGIPVAKVVRVVRGVTIASREVAMAEWSRLLAEQLAARARESVAARQALAGLLGQAPSAS